MCAVFDNPPYYSTKTPSSSVLTEVSHEAVARRPVAQPSTLGLSLWRLGAHFEIARSTVLGAVRILRSLAQRSRHFIALVVAVRCAF